MIPRHRSIAIVGASARAAAMSAIRAGFKPVAADLFADADLRRVARATRIDDYPNGLESWLSDSDATAWLYTGALENQPRLVDSMARRKPLYGNRGDVLTRVRAPAVLEKVLTSNGMPYPAIRLDPSGLPCDGSWLIKPTESASGIGIRALAGPAIGRTAAERARRTRIYYQQRIGGEHGAAVFVASRGAAQLLGMTRQLVGTAWTRAATFQYAGSIGPWLAAEADRRPLQKLGELIASEFKLRGLFGVDFVQSNGAIWTIEINPRYTASVEVVERFAAVDALRLHIAAFESDAGPMSRSERPIRADRPAATGLATPHNRRRAFFGKAILFAQRDLTVGTAFVEWALSKNRPTRWPTVADIPAAGETIRAGQPILTLFAEASSDHVVADRLRERLAAVETRLYGG